MILDWCNTGTDVSPEDMQLLIQECKTVQQLRDLYNQHPEYKQSMLPLFEQHKKLILLNEQAGTIHSLNHLKTRQNGTSH